MKQQETIIKRKHTICRKCLIEQGFKIRKGAKSYSGPCCHCDFTGKVWDVQDVLPTSTNDDVRGGMVVAVIGILASICAFVIICVVASGVLK